MTETTTLGPWDELLDERGEPRPAAAEVMALVERHRRRGAAGPAGRGGVRHPRHGDHVHRLLRGLEHRPGVAVRRHPADHRGPRVGGGRARPRAAPAGPQHVHRRRLQRPPLRRRRRVPGRPARRLGELPPRVPGRAPEVRRVGAHLRVRPRARRRRHDVRPRGQPARAVGRQLRDGEPGRRQEGVPRGLRPPEHRPGRRLHRRAQQAARVARAGRRQPTRRSPC